MARRSTSGCKCKMKMTTALKVPFKAPEGRWPGQDEVIGLSFGLEVDVKWKEGKIPAKVLRFVSK